MLLNLLRKLFTNNSKGIINYCPEYTIDIFDENRGWVRYEDFHGQYSNLKG